MKFDINLHVHLYEPSERATQMLAAILAQGDVMSASLDKITAEVAETKTVMQSAVVLIAGLAGQIRDLKDDPAALSALADSLDTDSSALADAVTANTPAA